MARYMLYTDTATYIIRGKMAALDSRIASVASEELCISVVTRGELLYGIKLNAETRWLGPLVDQFLSGSCVFPGMRLRPRTLRQSRRRCIEPGHRSASWTQ
jgi:predicted nucleic acid-binding protein